MPIEGVDYSVGRPDPACLAAAGKKFAARYVSNPGGIDKDMSPAETRALTAAGIAICTNWESWETRPLDGFEAGVSDAREAWRLAAISGMPLGRPIYFSVDFDASATQLAGPVKAYFQGCAQELGLERVGAYGGIRTIKFLFDNNLIKWGWQTFAWSSGQWDSRAHVQQYNNAETVCGVSLDLDRAMVADYGQWFAFQEEDMQEALDAIAEIKAMLLEDRTTINSVKRQVANLNTHIDAATKLIRADLSHKPNLIDFRQMARGTIDAFSVDTARETDPQ